jgi:carboxyl-terminal processing protease
MRLYFTTALFFFQALSSFSQSKFQKDFSFYWQTINDNFAYFDRQRIDWNKVKALYERSANSITNSNDFVHLLETVNNELYNGHVFLNTNTQSSNRTIPSGSDLKVSWLNRQFVITELREQFNAENCGLKVGMQVIKFDDRKMEEAIKKFLPRSAASIDREMYEYAGNMLLAGTHDSNRKITIMLNGREKIFNPDSLPNKTEENPPRLLEEKLLPGNIGYIKINNSLGNMDLVEAFDNTLKIFSNTIALIIDLRETPSGGTTSVARGIMGCFISKEQPYQKHIYSSEEKETGIRRSALELVTPRGPIYKKPLVVLVGYWTGSMGEGIAIGFDGMKRATIAGTRMAGLLGEIFTFRTPELNIPFSFPCVKLQHINGQPREDFIPPFLIKDQKQALQIASRLLRKK